MLYDKDGKIFNTEGFKETRYGSSQARIYERDNVLLKAYKYPSEEDVDKHKINPIKRRIFEDIKEMNNENIVKLLNYYYEYDKHFLCPIDAYTMEKENNDHVDIVEADNLYLTSSVEALDKLAKELAKRRIIMWDCHEKNILFSSKGPTIIDVDMFFKKLYSKTRIEIINKRQILLYLKRYTLDCYSKKHPNPKDEMTDEIIAISNIFNIRVNSKIDLAHELNKRLQSRPIKKILKNTNNC